MQLGSMFGTGRHKSEDKSRMNANRHLHSVSMPYHAELKSANAMGRGSQKKHGNAILPPKYAWRGHVHDSQ